MRAGRFGDLERTYGFDPSRFELRASAASDCGLFGSSVMRHGGASAVAWVAGGRPPVTCAGSSYAQARCSTAIPPARSVGRRRTPTATPGPRRHKGELYRKYPA